MISVHYVVTFQYFPPDEEPNVEKGPSFKEISAAIANGAKIDE